MADHRIIPSEDSHPSVRLFPSPTHPLVFVMIDSGLSTHFHITRPQVASLIAALQDADNELAAREVWDSYTENLAVSA